MLKSKKLLFLIPALAVALFSYTFVAQSEKEEALDQVLMQSLSNIHFAPLEINDKFSEKVYKFYIQRLDYNKKFLLQSDFDELKKYEHSIDEDVNAGRFNFFNKSLEIISDRIQEAQTYYKDILSQPIDFTKEETIQLDAEKLNFCKSKDELKDAWRKSMKYQVLAKMGDMLESQEKAKEKSDTVKIKTKEEIQTSQINYYIFFV